MSTSRLLINLLDRGELVAPFGSSIHVPMTCCLLRREGLLIRREAHDFRDRMFEEPTGDLEFFGLLLPDGAGWHTSGMCSRRTYHEQSAMYVPRN